MTKSLAKFGGAKGGPPKEFAVEPSRRRMSPEARESIILKEATAYFAELGLSAGTLELARRIGITQPLLYRYFPTKDALITRVYERLMPKNRFAQWESVLDDNSVSVRERLKNFYIYYCRHVLTYEHVRLFLFSGLSRTEFNAEYYKIMSDRIFRRMALALRREYGGIVGGKSVTLDELELVNSIHATVYNVAHRRWVHEEPIADDDLPDLISRKIDFCLDGAECAFRWLPKQPR